MNLRNIHMANIKNKFMQYTCVYKLDRTDSVKTKMTIYHIIGIKKYLNNGTKKSCSATWWLQIEFWRDLFKTLKSMT